MDTCYNKKENLLHLPSGDLRMPVFLPDATYGFVKSMTCRDLTDCGIEGLVMNVFHLMRKPGSSVIKRAGGVHRFYNWPRPVITDSGGFQVYSMIRENPKYGTITGKGIIFYPDKNSGKINLTPEKSIRLQLSYGADIVICLDDCTHVSHNDEINRASVERTIKWAGKCKKEYDNYLKQKKREDRKPLIFAVIQGGNDYGLRKICAEALLEIGFHGYGFGGYPLDEKGEFLTDIVQYTRSLVPEDFPMFALGIGHPLNIVKCIKAGYEIFDCSLPTRDARRGRLYVIDRDASVLDSGTDGWFSYKYVYDKKYIDSHEPVCHTCECHTCKNYSLSFLHHLFKLDDHLFSRLSTIHNLTVMTGLMNKIRKELRKNGKSG